MQYGPNDIRLRLCSSHLVNQVTCKYLIEVETLPYTLIVYKANARANIEYLPGRPTLLFSSQDFITYVKTIFRNDTDVAAK